MYIVECLVCNNVTYDRKKKIHKKRLQHSCFPVKFVKFFRTPFLTEHLQ